MAMVVITTMDITTGIGITVTAIGTDITELAPIPTTAPTTTHLPSRSDFLSFCRDSPSISDRNEVSPDMDTVVD